MIRALEEPMRIISSNAGYEGSVIINRVRSDKGNQGFDAKSGEFLGAHLIGAEVTELIQGYAISKTLEATEEDLMSAIFPHPTLSEAMHESVLGAFGQVIHI